MRDQLDLFLKEPRLLSSDHKVGVAWADSPFGCYTNGVYHDLMPQGLSIAEILERIPRLPFAFERYGVVCVNEQPVPKALWRYVRPRADGPVPVAVTLHVPAHGGAGGGGGGGKNIWATVANVALIALSLAITTFLPPLGVPLLVAQGLALGATLAGSLIISALTPPPVRQQTAGAPVAPGPAAATGNVVQPGGVIPRVVGTYRVFPPLVSEPYIDLHSDDEYVVATFGLAGPHLLSDIRVDNASVADLADVQLETRAGFSTDLQLTLQTVITKMQLPQVEVQFQKIDPNQIFNNHAHLLDQSKPDNDVQQWLEYVTSNKPDQVHMHVYFPEGVQGSANPTEQIGIPIRIRIRRRGQVAWINLPEIHFSAAWQGLMRKNIRIIWGTAPTFVAPPAFNAQNQGFIAAFKTVPVQTLRVGTSGGWTADPAFSAGAGSDVMDSAGAGNVLNVRLFEDAAEFYLSANVFPKDYYQVQIMRGSPYKSANLTHSSYSYAGGIGTQVTDFFGYINNGPGTFEINSWSTGLTLAHRMFLARFISLYLRGPVAAAGRGQLALISIKAKNRTLANVSVLASGYVNDYVSSPAGWTNLTTTSNPAPHARDMLVGALNARALSVAQLDDASFVAWRANCITNNYLCNVILDGKSIWDSMILLTGSGYGRLTKSETWGIAIDQDRSRLLPVQIFTPRNMSNFKWTKAFPILPDYFIASFNDETQDYQQQQVLVYASGFGTGSPNSVAQLAESVDYIGLTTQAGVIARATFDLNQARERGVFYTGNVGPENIVCRRGDLVGVQHDILAQYAGFARVVSKIVSPDGFCTGVNLDSVIPLTGIGNDFFDPSDVLARKDIFAAGSRIGVCIRLLDGSLLIEEIDASAGGEASAVNFINPFPDEAHLDEDCLVASGILGSETRRLVVTDIKPTNDYVAAISMVDEASDLFPAPPVAVPVVITISQNDTNINLRNTYDALGYPTPTVNQVITFILAPNILIGSSTTTEPGIDVGTWPATTQLLFYVYGTIVGAGGSTFPARGGNDAAQAGLPGGTALLTRHAITVFNAGLIGGGGGGGATAAGDNTDSQAGPGGGAGSIVGLGSIGARGGTAGQNGTLLFGGIAGTGTLASGHGGDLGHNGQASFETINPAAGGVAGDGVDGNSFVTFSILGDVRGPRVN